MTGINNNKKKNKEWNERYFSSIMLVEVSSSCSSVAYHVVTYKCVYVLQKRRQKPSKAVRMFVTSILKIGVQVCTSGKYNGCISEIHQCVNWISARFNLVFFCYVMIISANAGSQWQLLLIQVSGVALNGGTRHNVSNGM